MSKRKRNTILVIVGILLFIFALWISGIIPKQIAKISSTIYLKKNFPKMQLEYVNIEWSSAFGDYIIKFRDENNELHSFCIGPKYFPTQLGQGLFGFEEEYREKYGEQLENDNKQATIKAVVVKVEDNSMLVMGIEKRAELYSVGLRNAPDIEFKKGQEILIYFDGNVMESYPAQLGNIGKIEIIKEESSTQIPDNIIRYCYNSYNNVNINVLELTSSGVSLTITDTNELPYKYSHNYKINKKVKNKDYTGVGQKVGENTKNSTSGFTRNRIRIYMGRSRENFEHFKPRYRRNISI